MADEQYRWLDRETAERLLSGQPLEAVDAAAREQVEQLAETLGTLAVPPSPTSEELPGEAAALAAFRKVQAERGATLAAVGTPAAGPPRDAGVVRLGRRAWRDGRRFGRPARLGLAAALAAGMLGGVAVAAGTGVLPSPFPTNEPEPAASVSVAEIPEPLITPAPDGSTRGDRTPGGDPDGESGDGRDEDGTGQDSASPGPEQESAAERAERIASACRDMRDGKKLSAQRKRDLERAAGGASLKKYCEAVLAGGADGAADGDDQGDTGTGPGSGGQSNGKGNGKPGGSEDAGHQGGQDDQKDEEDREGQGDQGDQGGARDDAGEAPGGGRTDSAAAQPAEPAPTPMTTASEAPSESPAPRATL